MENPLCPQCRTPLPMQALAGLCPACMFEQGAFDSQSNIASSTFIPPAIEELAPLFPTLEIQELIGRGGMGAVYKARQIELDRVVALKILPSDIARDPAFSERFSREARALAKLNHPGIVALFEFGRSGDLFFFLMEFVDGVTLRLLLLGERLSAREALAIVPRICDALQYAHDRGIVHRDIKPENILLDRQGNVKIADFGLVKLVDPGPALADPVSGDMATECRFKAEMPAYTEAGKLMGTPAYMAPEQIDHPSGVDHRADIYALGVIFYQMLTGELPDKPLSPPSSHVLIDVRLDEVVIRALQRLPSLRFQQAEEFKTRVEEIVGSLEARPTIKSKFSPLRIAGVALILCLPLSLAIPILTRTIPPGENLEESTFTAPGPESREAKAEVIKQALRPFPGIILSLQSEGTTTYSSSGTKLTNQWRIGVKDVDRDRASKRLDHAVAAVGEALNRDNADPLRETIHFVVRSSMNSAVMGWRGDIHYVRQIRWAAMAGIFLSAIGILCVSLPRASGSPPVSKTPGRISFAFLVAGGWGIFVVSKHYSYIGIQMLPIIASITAVPAMIFGLSARSGRLGKLVAAISWCGLLGLILLTFFPGARSYRESGWETIAIPAHDRTAAPVYPGKPMRGEKEEKPDAVRSWLETIDAGKYAEAWERTSSLTRTLETEAAWIEKTKHLRETFGQTIRRKGGRTTWTSALPGAPEGIYYIISFATDFTIKHDVVETVTLIYQDDGNWRVLGYSIQ